MHQRYYATEFQQRVFIEDDPKNDCNDYKETSYDDCDRKFVKDFFLNKILGFMPIWATNNYSEVTEFWNGTSRISDEYHDIISGGRKTGKKSDF